MTSLNFVDLPDRPSLQRQWKKAYGPKGLKPLEVITLGDCVRGLLIHRDETNNRMTRCLGEGNCPFCEKPSKVRWIGYVAAFRVDTKEFCLAEITEGAARQLSDLGKYKSGLRGHYMTLARYKDYKNAPVFVSLRPHGNPGNLPPDWDIVFDLEHLWGILERPKRSTDERARDNGTLPGQGQKLGDMLRGIGR